MAALTAAVAATPGMFATGAAQAQEASAGAVQLPEVSVQAGAIRGHSPVQGFVAGVSAAGTKTDTPIIETPQSISIVTADEIAARSAQNLNQILRYTPGVIPESRGAAAVRLDQMTIRGYSPAQYLDGMRLAGGRDANPSLDAYRLERVEVLRGPASVLYGSSPPGGLINAVSKRPTQERIREVLLEAGTRAHYRAAGDFSGRLDENGQWLGRVVGSYWESDGELDEVRQRRYFISPSLTWRPSADTSITLLGHYQRDPEAGSYGAVPAWGSVLNNPNGRIGMRWFDGDANFEKLDREHYMIGYAAEHRATSWLTLRQNFRYLHTQGEYRSFYHSIISANLQDSVRSIYGTDADFDVFTVDNQAQANFTTGPVSHTVLVGLDYTRTLTDTYTGSALNTSPIGRSNLRQSLFRPHYANQGTTWPGFSTYSSQRTNQTGVYFQEQARFGGLVLLAGGRLDWYDNTTENRRAGDFTPTGTPRNTAHAFTGRVGAVYLFDNGLAPYVSYSESFEPQSGTDRFLSPFDPTTGRQYEAGLRFQPPGTNLLLSAAVFDLLRQNVLTTDPVNRQFSIQAGETHTRGVELEAKATLADGLSLTAAYTYLDVEYSKSNNVTRFDPGIEGAATGPDVPLQGKTPYAIPRHAASAWLDYSPAKGPMAGLGIAGGVRYIGSSWGDDANTLKVGSATLFDAALRYDLGQLGQNFEGMQATLNINNLADTRYVASCYSYAWCWYGYGRTVTGGLRYRF
ncbi:TonB-dependent siderophore receptor [Pseudoroseomonas globiformis]|uniref:TonB-dependent siderophore receptor n=1 Tax=Teichococcus globiformis TaxID=2307229 RepID=A0ABV7FY40_9PROT